MRGLIVRARLPPCELCASEMLDCRPWAAAIGGGRVVTSLFSLFRGSARFGSVSWTAGTVRAAADYTTAARD